MSDCLLCGCLVMLLCGCGCGIPKLQQFHLQSVTLEFTYRISLNFLLSFTIATCLVLSTLDFVDVMIATWQRIVYFDSKRFLSFVALESRESRESRETHKAMTYNHRCMGDFFPGASQINSKPESKARPNFFF